MNFLDGYIQAGSKIKNKAARHEFYGSIIDYYMDDSGAEPIFKSDIAEVAFWAVKFSIDKARAGRIGGQANSQANPEANPEANAKQTAKQTPKQTPSKPRTKEEEEEVYKKKPSKEGKKDSRFSPPSVDDVRTYCRENNYDIDPEQFFDHYTANGWKVGGKTPMKDWKASVRTWARRDKSKGVSADDFTRFD